MWGRRVRRTYAHPPIQEAVCQFNFYGGDWDFASSSDVYSRLKTRYSAPPVQLLSAGVQVTPEPASQSVTIATGDMRTRLSSPDGRGLVTIAENLLAVHDLPPYSGWEKFQAEIEGAFDAYADVAKPEGLAKIGIRYINRLDFVDPKISLSDYFTHPPTIPELFSGLTGFFQRYEFAVTNSPAKVVLIFASAEAPEGYASSIMLDLDVVRTWETGDLTPDGAMQVVDEIRTLERHSFESLITDKAREMFQ